MNDVMAESSDRHLERELDQLRGWVAFPPTPDLATPVAARVRSERPRRLSTLGGHRLLYAAVALLLLLFGATLVSGTVRDAVADMFGIPGITIEIDRDQSVATVPAAQLALTLGAEVQLSGLEEQSGFKASMLDPTTHGLPDAVFVRDLPDGTALVSLTYDASDTLPNTAETGLGLLLMEFEAPYGVQTMVKSMRGDGRFEETFVHGMLAFWIEGTTELQIVGDDVGPRPSGNILLWQANGVTFRMESALTMDAAIALAEEMTIIHPSLLTPASEP